MNLLDLTESGGCACKLDSEKLEFLINTIDLKNNIKSKNFTNLDDCSVYPIDDNYSIISSLDFFSPVIDTAYEFGQISVASALSDIYATGGNPNYALNILGFPECLDLNIVKEILKGASDKCKEAGVDVLGGHTIINPQPIFGLSVNSIIENKFIKNNNMAKEGDFIFLTKPLGLGILSKACKIKELQNEHRIEFIKVASLLNKIGYNLSQNNIVSSMTDVTGFGLIGHLSEICTASNVSVEIKFSDIPVFDFLKRYTDKDIITTGSKNNVKNYSKYISANLSKYQESVLFDPQTNGGLLCFVCKENLKEFKNMVTEFYPNIILDSIGNVVSRTDNDIISIK